MKTKDEEVHVVVLVDIRHIQKYEYIPENVHESSLKCGNQAQMKELYTNFQKVDEAGMRAENQNWNNH